MRAGGVIHNNGLRFLADQLAENAGYMVVATALTLINRAAALALPFILRGVVDALPRGRPVEITSTLVATLAAAIAVQAATAYFLNSTIARHSFEIASRVRLRLAHHVLDLPVSFHENAASGALAARVFNDCDSIRHAVGFPLFDFVGSVIAGVGAALVLARLNAAVTGATLAAVTAAAGGLAFCVLKSRTYLKKRSGIIAASNGQLAEAFATIRVLKIFVAEAQALRSARRNEERLMASVADTTRLSSTVTAVRIVLGGGAILLVLYTGMHEVGRGRLSIGGLMAALVLLAWIGAALMQAGAAAIQLSESLAGADRIRELLAREREQDDPARVREFRLRNGHVVFDNVSFTYEGRSQAVLDGVSFDLAPGTMTALVGASGAGKSTTAALLAALHTPNEGRVLVDGQDLRGVKLSSYRRTLAVVPQEVSLMNGTVRDNVRLGRPGASAAEVLAACHRAYVDEFVQGMPLGYETEIGERGVQLSGGQRQRVAIARALLADPAILILDEPTATLDDDSAAMVQRAIRAAVHGRTVLVIAHSLAVVRDAQQVIVLNGGRIVERGRPAELNCAGSRFTELYGHQAAASLGGSR